MQTATHYSSFVRNTNGTFRVVRKAGNVKVATVSKLHRGWLVDLGAGRRHPASTKEEAFLAAVRQDS